MKYIIMLLIVIGLAIMDFITGFIKAYVKDDVSSKKMRTGGLNKVMEILIMTTACGLEIGITALGKYYQEPKLASVAGILAAGAVFIYIVIMELTSILENYAEANPKAKWALKLVKKLRIFQQKEEEADGEKEDDDVSSEDKT